MRRFDRILPWLPTCVLLCVVLLGVAWDAAFEATPSNSDLVSQGDDRIRELKVEVGDRGEDELCWGTGATSGCPASGDNGFAREGSARGFFATAAPTTLNDAATTALGTGHDGRLWTDNDGTDNVDANLDDNSLHFWNGSAFEKLGLGALGTMVLTAPATGHLLRYDGTNFVNAAPAALFVRDEASFANNETFTNGTCAVDCTVADIPDHLGGSDSVGAYPEIAVPATATLLWTMRVYGYAMFQLTSSNAGPIICQVQHDTNDAEAWTDDIITVGELVANNNGDVRRCTFDYIIGPVSSTANHAVRLMMTDSTGAADWDVDSTGAPVLLRDQNFIAIEARPHTLY